MGCEGDVVIFRFQKLMVEVFLAMRVHVVEMDQVFLELPYCQKIKNLIIHILKYW